MNWRGLFSMGTAPSGASSTVPVEWPGFSTTAYHSRGETQRTTKNWMGSLLEGQRDAGGQMYMRNRYYDPATGQFTQTDPIGIAGGLNTYGFANGDPVSFLDPYGLRADSIIYDSPKTQLIVQSAASKAPTLGQAIREINEDPQLLVFVTQVAPGSLGPENPGSVTPIGFTTQDQYVFEVRFDFTRVPVMQAMPKYAENGGVNIHSVVGHEFYGHVYPWSGKTPDGRPSMCADWTSCPVDRENIIRQELGYPPRTW